MAQIRCWDNGSVGTVDIDGSSLGDKVKTRLLSSVVRMYELNRRQGTVKTKTRAETAYTENKPYRQKGTGNARRGDRNSPLLRGGGVIFGPRPRDHVFHHPRKALREALRSSLVGKLRDSEVCALTSGAFSEPKTKTARAALDALECSGSTCVVLPSDNEVLLKSFRNVPRTHTVRAADLNADDVLRHHNVLLVDDAWDVLIARLAHRERKAKAGAA